MNLPDLLPKLPQVREWIERTLAAHRTETRSAASYRFQRLPQFFSPVFLETAFVVELPRVPLPPFASFGLAELAEFEKSNPAAITYRNTYFVREGAGSDESVHFHELIHVVQWQHLGLDGFLTAYATGFAQHGYRDNPLEAMAFEFQADFDQGGKPKDLKSLIRTRLGPRPAMP